MLFPTTDRVRGGAKAFVEDASFARLCNMLVQAAPDTVT